MSSALFFHNTVQDWLFALGLALFILATALTARGIGHRRLSALAAGSTNDWVDLLVELIDRLHALFLLAAAVYLGSLRLSLADPVRTTLDHIVLIIVLIQVAYLSSHAVSFWVERFRRRKLATDGGAVTTIISLGFLLQAAIWVILVLIGLDNMGVNVTALVAGLGITGIAVALAIQNILGDLFASFSIVLDKPFVIGDFIAVDGYMGTVEHIGLKTTRVRSLSGEQLIFANADLLKSRIRNFQRMRERRVAFPLRVAYHTPVDKLQEIPEMIRVAVEKHAKARFERAHFSECGEFALKFEAVYWVTTPDYVDFMDIQQAVNLEILSRFKESAIEFACPVPFVIPAR